MAPSLLHFLLLRKSVRILKKLLSNSYKQVCIPRDDFFLEYLISFKYRSFLEEKKKKLRQALLQPRLTSHSLCGQR